MKLKVTKASGRVVSPRPGINTYDLDKPLTATQDFSTQLRLKRRNSYKKVTPLVGLSLNKYRSLVLGRSVKDLHVTSDPVAYGFNDNDNPIGHFSGHTSPTAVETAVRDTSASLAWASRA